MRSGFVGSWSRDLSLVGPELVGELNVYRALRLDVGATWQFGAIDQRHAAQSFVLELGAARRFGVARRFDLDLGFLAQAGVLDFPDARAVDGIVGQHQTWSARLEGRGSVWSRGLSRSARGWFWASAAA